MSTTESLPNTIERRLTAIVTELRAEFATKTDLSRVEKSIAALQAGQ